MKPSSWLICLFLVGTACSTSSSTSGPPPAQAFVGTWARSGTSTTACPGQAATQAAITGTLAIVQGADGSSIVATDSVNNCRIDYTVSGNVATAKVGETCTYTNPRGGQNQSTQGQHTFTLSTDGTSMTTSANLTLVVGSPDGGASQTCTVQSEGTFTKQ